MKRFYFHSEALLTKKSLYQRAADGAESSKSLPISASDDVSLETFYTAVGEPYTNDTLSAIWVFTVNAVSLGLSTGLKLYAKVSKREPDDSETLLFTTDKTAALDATKKTLTFSKAAAGTLAVGDRLKIEIRCANEDAVNAGTASFYYEQSAIAGAVTRHSQFEGPDLFAFTHDTGGLARLRAVRRR